MSAVIGRELGSPDSYELQSVATPTPGKGQVRVSVRAAGISFVDVLIAAGKYQLKPPLPYTPGTEFAGVVEAVGEGVSEARIGERVCATGMGGGFAQAACAPAASTIAIPETMAFEEAAVFRVNYATAYHALVQRAATAAGENVLVVGAGGGVGLACIQVAKALGARVVASASSAAKRALASESGADDVLDAAAPDWREQLRSLTDGRGVDVVVDPVGGAETERAFRSLAWRGRHLVIGFAAGEIPRLPTNLALLKGASLHGVDLRQFAEKEPGTAAANLERLFSLAQSGALRPRIGASFPLTAFRDAMHAAADRNQTGRVVLLV